MNVHFRYFWIIIALPVLLGATVLRDPTQPPDAKTNPSTMVITGGSFELSAIFVYPNKRLAIINGQIVKPGDQIGEYSVTTIESDTVELTGPQNKSEVLHLVAPVKQQTIVKGR